MAKAKTLTIQQIKNLLKKGKEGREGMAALIAQVSDLHALVLEKGQSLKDVVDGITKEQTGYQKQVTDLTTLNQEIDEFLGTDEVDDAKAE